MSVIAMHHHHVKQAGACFIRRARASVAKNGATLRIQLSLNKQIAECRVCQIAGIRCQYDFSISCQFQRAGLATTMDQCEPSQLNIILRGDHHLSFDAKSSKGASEFSPRIGEQHFLVLSAGVACRLPGIAPYIPRLRITDVAECSPVITGGITAPAC